MPAMTEMEELKADIKTLQEDVKQLTQQLKQLEGHRHTYGFRSEWTGVDRKMRDHPFEFDTHETPNLVKDRPFRLRFPKD